MSDSLLCGIGEGLGFLVVVVVVVVVVVTDSILEDEGVEEDVDNFEVGLVVVVVVLEELDVEEFSTFGLGEGGAGEGDAVRRRNHTIRSRTPKSIHSVR